jgi:hypothetical protein
VKTVFRAILCTVLAAVALTMALFTAAGFRRAEAARAAGYVLGLADGSVAVYAGGDLRRPIRVTDIQADTLREHDRAALAEGLPVATKEELLQLLEDLAG